MNLRKAAILIGCLILLVGVCSPAVAVPPGDPGWHEGEWKFVAKESCARHTGGKSLGKYNETLYMQLIRSGTGYFAYIFLSPGATDPGEAIGFAIFEFGVPLAEAETHLVRGQGFKFVFTGFLGASGSAEFSFRGALLKSAFPRFHEGMAPEKIRKLQRESKMAGWILTDFTPHDPERFPFANCGGNWEAEWIGPLAIPPV